MEAFLIVIKGYLDEREDQRWPFIQGHFSLFFKLEKNSRIIYVASMRAAIIYISYNMSDGIESKYYISGGTIKQMQLKYSSCYKNELPANGFFCRRRWTTNSQTCMEFCHVFFLGGVELSTQQLTTWAATDFISFC